MGNYDDMEWNIVSYGEPDPAIKKELIANIEASRPDRVKEAYERVMIEAGLMKGPPKIWLPK